jgi:hypothetical protein
VSRSAAVAAVAVVAAIVMAACSSAPSGTASSSTSAKSSGTSGHKVVSRIIPAPRGLISGAVPQPNGSMWVLAGGKAEVKTLTDIDLSDGQKIATVPVSAAADALAQSTTGVLALGTATTTSGSVELLNGSSGSTVSTIAIGAPVRSLAFGSDGVTLYVLNGTTSSTSVTVVNTSDGQTATSVGSPKDAVDLQVDPDQSEVWTVQSNGNVQATSLQSGRSAGIIPLDLSGIALAYPSSGTRMYVLKGSSSVWNIADISAGATSISRTIPAAAHSVDLLASPDGSTLYDLVGTASVGNIQLIRLPAGSK